MFVKLLAEHHLEFLSSAGGCGGSFESTLVKMSNCWKSQSTALMILLINIYAFLISIGHFIQKKSCLF